MQFSDAYIVVKETIRIREASIIVKITRQVIFKNCALFTKYISETKQ